MTQGLSFSAVGALLAVLAFSYLVGAIPWAYLVVRRITGEDVTAHGTGNVGAMNVRRTTGSWRWFAVVMLLDAAKGLVPVLVARGFFAEDLGARLGVDGSLAAMAAVVGAVVGHSFSVWMMLLERRVFATGKGLATGGGALLAYDPLYFVLVLAVGIGVIALTRYMMAGQVAAAVSLPLFAALLGREDWPFTLVLAGIVYSRHHRRFVGLLRGEEPRLYVEDGQGPRG